MAERKAPARKHGAAAAAGADRKPFNLFNGPTIREVISARQYSRCPPRIYIYTHGVSSMIMGPAKVYLCTGNPSEARVNSLFNPSEMFSRLVRGMFVFFSGERGN